MRPEEYWIERALDRMTDIELMGNGYAQRIHAVYLAALTSIEADILKLFERFRDQGNLTVEEAAALLREPVDRQTREWLLALIESMEDSDERRRLLAQINSPSYAARLSRLQALKMSLRAECARVAGEELPLHTEAYRAAGEEAYYRTVFDIQQQAADALGGPVEAPFSRVTLAEIDTVARERWSGRNFSERVWADTRIMAEKLAEIVRVNQATGRSWRQCLREVAGFAATPGQGALYAAERILRTEMSYVANQEALRSMAETGFTRYRFIATLDTVTSEICQRHDGRIDPDTGKPYEVKKAKTGVNVPPLHPNCRSTIAPTVEGETLAGLTRSARDPETGKPVQVDAEMTYPEWLKSFNDEQMKAYTLRRNKALHRSSDARQYERYKAVLGKDAPKTLDAFQELKYTDAERWGFYELDYQRRDELLKNPKLKLPFVETVTAADEKFTRYLFNPENADGYAKGVAFDSRLGYNKDNWKKLQKQILERAPVYPATYKYDNKYGTGYEQKMVLYGLRNKPANVIVGWLVGDGSTKMTACYIKEVK